MYAKLLAPAALLLAAMPACRRAAPPQRTFLAMGTFFSVTLPADRSDYMEPVGVLSANALYALEDKFSLFRPESEISRLNRTAGGPPEALSPQTAELLDIAGHYSRLSAGAFDITVGPLMHAWGFRGGGAAPGMPSPEALEQARALAGFDMLMVSNQTARLALPGMQVDAGGIAKGYAVDYVYRIMEQHGVSDVLLNLGGNIRARGRADSKRPWRVAVRHPFEPDNALGWLDLLPGEAIATSGNYEQFVLLDGRRYSHIMDPRTGYPVAGMAAVTVLAPDATRADALSTMLFVTGVEEGARLLRSEFTGSSALFVPDVRPLEIYLTGALIDRFMPNAGFADCVVPIR